MQGKTLVHTGRNNPSVKSPISPSTSELVENFCCLALAVQMQADLNPDNFAIDFLYSILPTFFTLYSFLGERIGKATEIKFFPIYLLVDY